MPYISVERRNRLDVAVATLFDELEALGLQKGDLNYCISSLINLIIRHKGKSYNNLSDLTGVLNDVKVEFERKVVAPYEDKKEAQNGPVYDRDEWSL